MLTNYNYSLKELIVTQESGIKKVKLFGNILGVKDLLLFPVKDGENLNESINIASLMSNLEHLENNESDFDKYAEVIVNIFKNLYQTDKNDLFYNFLKIKTKSGTKLPKIHSLSEKALCFLALSNIKEEKKSKPVKKI